MADCINRPLEHKVGENICRHCRIFYLKGSLLSSRDIVIAAGENLVSSNQPVRRLLCLILLIISLSHRKKWNDGVGDGKIYIYI